MDYFGSLISYQFGLALKLHTVNYIGMEVADVFIVLWIGGGFRRRDGFCPGCNSLLLLLSLLELSTFFSLWMRPGD